MSNLTNQIILEIKALSDLSKIAMYTHFFRADEGDICFGDKFLAVKVPEVRKLVKKYFAQLSLEEIKVFLNSGYNEIRFFGLAVTSSQFYKTHDTNRRSELVSFLKSNISRINHWNLVDDISKVFGDYCLEVYDFDLIQDFSTNESIWVRRIAIVSCLQLIRTKNKEYLTLVLQIVTNNIGQTHEYVHKAMGWILREVGKLDENILIEYLHQNWHELAPVTRSYATEKLRLTRNTKLLFGSKV
jgi:3-methyladenine DNA glycosylase AlkD